MEALRIARERVQSNPMSDAAQFQLGAALQRASVFFKPARWMTEVGC